MSDTNTKIKYFVGHPLDNKIKDNLNEVANIKYVQEMAVMPDIHWAGDICVGTVISTKEVIIPQAIGGDIGCGMTALKFRCKNDLFKKIETNALYNDLKRFIPSKKHRSPINLPSELSNYTFSSNYLEKCKDREGRYQFGTLGSGNHFLEFQTDDEENVWVTVHTGSRFMGKAIRDHYISLTKQKINGIHFLKANSELGQAYLRDAEWAQKYANYARLFIISNVSKLLNEKFNIKKDEESLISCHHNFIETQDDLYVHRKGALKASLGIKGIIPGSMGHNSYHISGLGNPDSLDSCSHGAGRSMSRTSANKSINVKDFRSQMKGIIYDKRQEKGLIEEAPKAYKNIKDVMKAQKELVKIDRILKPILNYKGL